MCGIAGIIHRDNFAPSEEQLNTMVRSLEHRGPDDEGTYMRENVALGHRRLSILDLSSAGHQPMASADKSCWITYNGEVYNYLEIKEELKDVSFKSTSDTEVILHGYQKWGPAVVSRLNGIFAFAIWDERKKELFAARDHLGVKPFYYAMENGVLYFASEIKALLAAGIKTQPNDKIIYDYLARGYYQHSHETFFKNIFQLPAGTTLRWRDGHITIQRYWDLAERVNAVSSLPEGDVSERFLHLFKDAVTLQLRSDVPIGIQLSGGFDSSAITAMVNKVSQGQKNFHLFSHIYGEHQDIEKPYMQALADGLGWHVNFIEIRPHHMAELAERVLWHQDEPFPGLPTFGLHMVAEHCKRQGIPVVLGGQGGDEIGGGYEYYMGAFLLDVMREKGGEQAKKELMRYGESHAFAGAEEHMNFFMNTLSSYLYGGTSADGTAFTHAHALRSEFLRTHASRLEFEKPFVSHFRNMQYRDILYTKLPRILHSADRAAMAYGVEQRVPFVDYRLIEYGLSLPGEHKIRDGEQRYFMRKAFRDLIPDMVRNAPKRAVPSPQREWFKKDLTSWIYPILASKSFAERPYFNQSAALEEYGRYCHAEHNPNSFHIWQWVHLELWLRKYFE
ncbi:MAG: asparagine synthase (glutamine-hydrolyzing) [Candidatus Niyogibacteria bacterium CG10_big_fil_rev_8_21_14_0_10_46_36]|uniref:asparagine synthase (glutamine-hydrolyzing) n=1 Tax=Candidatus Niyogibacteria bacterium CG10_big_fil_rev_8_21_14_0_10_46_36 TaxID=1974726 RepID=A0A2H0TEI2_9BACT|nr:MAG: asparagine synthase (glutamine-hydrolyzing) [Candidatus Niyogibacteria bacterium CG10_big_fil_rev_8_21_14_0_10_46_36]